MARGGRLLLREARSSGPVLLIYLLSRLAVAAATATVATLQLSGPRCGDAVSRPIEGLSALARCWDTAWYLRVTDEGYPHALPADSSASTLAFFPGYPAVVAAVHALGLPLTAAALLVSLVAGAVATVLVERMGRQVSSPAAARGAAVLFACFPGAVVLSWGYSEALAAALIAACLLAIGRDRPILAAIAAALAGTVRADAGIALSVAVLVAAVPRLRAGQARALAAPAIAGLGVLGHLGFIWAWTGSPLTWTRAQSEGWDQHLDGGLHTLISLGGVLLPFASPSRVVLVLAVVLFVAAVMVLVPTAARMPAGWSAATATLVAIALASSQVGFRPRAELLLLPAFVAAGDRLPARALPWVAAVLLVLQVLLTVLWLGTPLITPP